MKMFVIQRIISRKVMENQIVNNMENEIKCFASLSESSFLNLTTKRLKLKFKNNKFLTCDYDL